MKTRISTTLKSVFILAIMIVGVSVAFAWAPPTSPATNGNVPVSLNVSDFSQVKAEGITSEKYFIAGANEICSTGNNCPLGDGFILAKTLLASSRALFTHHVLVSGTTSGVKIGGNSTTSNNNFTFPLFSSATYKTPLTIDLSDRGTGSSGKNAMELLTDNSCENNVNILTNAPAVQYYSTKTDANADIIGRQVRLAGGNPRAGKILIATNSNGDAVWATPKLVNGQITFDTTVSPVTTSQTCTPPAAVLGCTDPTASNYNASATQDDGSCTYPEPTVCYQRKGNCPWNVSPYTTSPGIGCVRLDSTVSPYDRTCANDPTLPQEFSLWSCPVGGTYSGTQVSCP